MDMNYPVHVEQFEVVLLKDSVSDLSAKPDDFKRVSVEASSPIAAQISDKAKVQGYRAIFATKPGVLTDPEVMARRREADVHVDRSKIGM